MKYADLLNVLRLKYLRLANCIEQDYGIEATTESNRDAFCRLKALG